MPHVTVTWCRFKSDKFSNQYALLQVSRRSHEVEHTLQVLTYRTVINKTQLNQIIQSNIQLDHGEYMGRKTYRQSWGVTSPPPHRRHVLGSGAKSISGWNLPRKHVNVGPTCVSHGLQGYRVGMGSKWASYLGPTWVTQLGPTWVNPGGHLIWGPLG